MPSRVRPSPFAPIVVAFVIAALTSPVAQRRRGGDSDGAPVTTSAIVKAPEKYFGKPVTISAGVELVLSKTVFVVDQRKMIGPTEAKAIGAPMLVIAPNLAGPLDHKRYLLIKGQVVKFDPATIGNVAAGYTLDVPSDSRVKFAGQPVLVATSVISSTYVELAGKPAAPSSAETK